MASNSVSANKNLSQAEPTTRDDLLAELALIFQQADAFWRSLGDDDFFAPHGTQWSPAENVRHLTKSTLPVVWSLRTPRWILRLLFGAAPRPSRSYRQLVDRYLNVLQTGGQAGWFAPRKKKPPGAPDVARQQIMAGWRGSGDALLHAAGAWDDASLDRLRIPHPLLGKLTVREMLLFTLYHQRHHAQNVIRRQQG